MQKLSEDGLITVNCWPTPSNDGTCDVNIEYELENQSIVLHDLLISIPLPYVFLLLIPFPPYKSSLTERVCFSDGSYPTITSPSSTWTLNPSSHSLDWTVPLVSSSQNTTGSLEFTVGGDDAGAFFPVRVGFAAEGSVGGMGVLGVERSGEEGDVDNYSVDSVVISDEYVVQ